MPSLHRRGNETELLPVIMLMPDGPEASTEEFRATLVGRFRSTTFGQGSWVQKPSGI